MSAHSCRSLVVNPLSGLAYASCDHLQVVVSLSHALFHAHSFTRTLSHALFHAHPFIRRLSSSLTNMDNPSFRDVAGAPVTGTSSAQATTYRRVFTTKRTLALLFLLVLFVWLSWAVWRALATDKQFPGLGEVINWLSPYEWASLGVAFSLGLSVLGAGW